MYEDLDQPKQAGRDFLEAMGTANSFDREINMQVGDYIQMPWSSFRTWSGTQSNGGEEDRDSLPTEGDAMVSILGILREEGKPTQVTAEAGGIQRNVDASLFFNYRHPHAGTEAKAADTPGLLADEGNAG